MDFLNTNTMMNDDDLNPAFFYPYWDDAAISDTTATDIDTMDSITQTSSPAAMDLFFGHDGDIAAELESFLNISATSKTTAHSATAFYQVASPADQTINTQLTNHMLPTPPVSLASTPKKQPPPFTSYPHQQGNGNYEVIALKHRIIQLEQQLMSSPPAAPQRDLTLKELDHYCTPVFLRTPKLTPYRLSGLTKNIKADRPELSDKKIGSSSRLWFRKHREGVGLKLKNSLKKQCGGSLHNELRRRRLQIAIKHKNFPWTDLLKDFLPDNEMNMIGQEFVQFCQDKAEAILAHYN